MSFISYDRNITVGKTNTIITEVILGNNEERAYNPEIRAKHDPSLQYENVIVPDVSFLLLDFFEHESKTLKLCWSTWCRGVATGCVEGARPSIKKCCTPLDISQTEKIIDSWQPSVFKWKAVALFKINICAIVMICF